MKILLVHPDDSVEAGAWAETQWDLAVDLGWSGRHAYTRQTERLGFLVLSIYDLLEHEQQRRQMRDILALGLDKLLDSESVDWWDAFALSLPANRATPLIFGNRRADPRACRDSGDPSAPFVGCTVNRAEPPDQDFCHPSPDRLSRALPPLLESRICLPFRATCRNRVRQVGHGLSSPDDFVRPPRASSTPAILLPSAYSNVTRAQAAYARMLPHRRFLLVLTRRNGRIQHLPGNVEPRWLASYAPRHLAATDEERVRLLGRWQSLQNNLFETNRVLSLAKKLGIFDPFADFLKSGLGVRDAWREVFAREPIAAVLSADENNPYTRMPILLARSKKLRTVFCDHGALNMSFEIRPPVSDTYLMKGDMARDYGVTWCGLPTTKSSLAVPRKPATRRRSRIASRTKKTQEIGLSITPRCTSYRAAAPKRSTPNSCPSYVNSRARQIAKSSSSSIPLKICA